MLWALAPRDHLHIKHERERHRVHDLGLRYPDRTQVVIPAIVLADQSAWAGADTAGVIYGVHARYTVGLPRVNLHLH